MTRTVSENETLLLEESVLLAMDTEDLILSNEDSESESKSLKSEYLDAEI